MNNGTKLSLLYCACGLMCIFYCDIILYYRAVLQCPSLNYPFSDGKDALKAFVLADIHMVGTIKGHWLDRWRREWQMHRAFQSVLTIHQPDVVFILGDIFDEGQWSNKMQFEDDLRRFKNYFSVPDYIDMYVVAGNHDIGFHHSMRRGALERFTKTFNSPSVQLISAKGIHFVLINSMALHGDSCSMCKEARRSIQNISDILQCSQDDKCKGMKLNGKYSRPILMQHFPLFRLSDSVCTGSDAAPLPERNIPFRSRIDTLSKEATDYLVHKLKPRAAFGGHTHHGCLVGHKYGNLTFNEHSVPSFSWRNRRYPKYFLASITPEGYIYSKCELPSEMSIVTTFVFVFLFGTVIAVEIIMNFMFD